MNIENLGWLFYKKYYSGVDFTGSKDAYQQHFDKINNEITKTKYRDITELSKSLEIKTGQPFEPLQILYPGLLTGSGYTHQTGRLGEFKIGFYFDHTTGLPLIPGHSVKGAIRSAFPQYNKKMDDVIRKSKINSIISLIAGEIDCKQAFESYLIPLGGTNNIPSYTPELFLNLLERNIFDGLVPVIKNGKWEKDMTGNFIFQPLSIYKRDIFFDAYIVKGDSKKGLILATDSITPHGDDPLKNPNPILFLKIRSGVQLRFQFHCKDSIISAQEKLNLFRKILQTTGVGAKTNVGYGQFGRTNYNL